MLKRAVSLGPAYVGEVFTCLASIETEEATFGVEQQFIFSEGGPRAVLTWLEVEDVIVPLLTVPLDPKALTKTPRGYVYEKPIVCPE